MHCDEVLSWKMHERRAQRPALSLPRRDLGNRAEMRKRSLPCTLRLATCMGCSQDGKNKMSYKRHRQQVKARRRPDESTCIKRVLTAQQKYLVRCDATRARVWKKKVAEPVGQEWQAINNQHTAQWRNPFELCIPKIIRAHMARHFPFRPLTQLLLSSQHPTPPAPKLSSTRLRHGHRRRRFHTPRRKRQQ